MTKRKKQRWTESEERRLIHLWGQERPISEIAGQLKRAEPVIRAKVSHLRRRGASLRAKLKDRSVNENYKLTREAIPSIRRDARTLKAIALEHGVSAVTIYKIKTKQTWKDA